MHHPTLLVHSLDDLEGVDAMFTAYRLRYVVYAEQPDGTLTIIGCRFESRARRIADQLTRSKPDPRCTVTVYPVAHTLTVHH